MLIDLLLVALYVAGTVLLGWWAVLVVGAIGGLLLHRRNSPFLTGGALALVAWAGLLMYANVRGAPIPEFARDLGAILRLPGWGLYAMSLLFAGLLGGAACSLVAALLARPERARSV
jgi:hypothetical protein